MRYFSVIAIAMALLLSGLFGGELLARSAGLSRIVLDVPMRPRRQLGRAIDNVLVILKDRRFSYLDLTIQFPVDGLPPFAVTRDGQPVGRQSKGCSLGPLPLGGGRIYHLAPINNNRRLLLSVVTGNPALFPYLDISCEYKKPQVSALRVRGFFHIVCNRGPEALNLQLRPINPSLNLARQVLLPPVKRVAGQMARLAAKKPVSGTVTHPVPRAQKTPSAETKKGGGQRTAKRKKSSSQTLKCL